VQDRVSFFGRRHGVGGRPVHFLEPEAEPQAEPQAEPVQLSLLA